MIKKVIGKGKNFLNRTQTELMSDEKRVLVGKEYLDRPTSVLFFTTHKCASTFISSLLETITKNSDYELKDYDSAIWKLGDQININQGTKNFLSNFLEKAEDRLFFKTGEIYAPLRVPVDFPNRSNFKHIFFLRDPRDVIVSAYYSFGFTHTSPKNFNARKYFQSKRQVIQQQGIDNYALAIANEWIPRYTKYQEFAETSEDHLYLKYNEFQSDTVGFITKIVNYLEVNVPKQEIIQLASKASPVQTTTDNSKHKRSGKSQQYLEELKPETVKVLNEVFSEVLSDWNFDN